MIDERLLKEFKDFCKLNGIEPTKKINDILRNELNIMKYGTSPIDNIKIENNEKNKPTKKKLGRPKKVKPIETKREDTGIQEENIEPKKEEKQIIINPEPIKKVRIIKKR